MAKSKRSAKKAAKKSILKPEVFLQFAGNEYNEETIIEQIKETWYKKAEETSEITSLRLYLKPEETCVYYVINDTEQGKLDL